MGMLTLTTNNGLGDDNIIYLDPEVVGALLRYLDDHDRLPRRYRQW